MNHDLDRRLLLGAAGLAGVAALAAKGRAGPLNPPAGPISPTGRTTDEIYNRIPAGGAGDGRIALPGGTGTVTISNPGSYVLTGNIAATGGFGLAITADHVTVDLNGYTVGSAFTTSTGINISTGLKGITIRNGTISGFQIGVALQSLQSPISQVLIEDLFIKEAKQNGIQATTADIRSVIIRRCTITDTGATTTAADGNLSIAGIICSATSVIIEHCAVTRLIYNGSGAGTLRGIMIGGGTSQVVRGCSVTADTATLAAPSVGMLFASPGAVYRDNTVTGFSNKYSGGTDAGGNA